MSDQEELDYYNSKLEEDDFNDIVDPETNRTVPITSAIGQQVVKNYIECLKNGPDSVNIVSTKMFYKQSGSSNKNIQREVRGKCGGCKLNVYNDEPRVKKLGKYYHENCEIGINTPSSVNTTMVTSKISNKSVSGSIKGLCGGCKKNVYSTQERINHGGLYFHESCLGKTTSETSIVSTKNMGSIKGQCGGCKKNVYSTDPRVNNSGLYFHEKCFTP